MLQSAPLANQNETEVLQSAAPATQKTGSDDWGALQTSTQLRSGCQPWLPNEFESAFKVNRESVEGCSFKVVDPRQRQRRT